MPIKSLANGAAKNSVNTPASVFNNQSMIHAAEKSIKGNTILR